MNRVNRTIAALFHPIDIAPLVFFRVALGGIMIWEVWRYFHYTRITRYYVEPDYWFTYWGFHWVRPLPGDGMYILFIALAVLAFLVMIGAAYRISTALLWLGFTYVFLLDQAQYLNHFYLMSLVFFLMIFIPAHRACSVDAWLRPALRTQTVPFLGLALLRGQMAVVYVFGGIAKINPDWLRGEPMRQWMAARTDFPLIGQWFTEEWMVYLFSYGGLLFDLLIVPFILWRRTRIPALLLMLAFHLTNYRLFNIGVFPWFAIAITLLYLPPHWFRWPIRPSSDQPTAASTTFTRTQRLLLLGFGIYFALQIALPLRHFFMPGYVSWTEEGHNLAWHMRLRSKSATIIFFASDPTTGVTERIPVEDMLSSRQYSQMSDNPQMILRLAHHLARTDYAGWQIRVWNMVSLNSRPPQLLIDPTVDLASQPDRPGPASWIIPLVQHPAPYDARPALLLSRPQPGVLILTNMTAAEFPADTLHLQSDQWQFSGTALNLPTLLPGDCTILHTAGADLQTLFSICNEVERQQLTAPIPATFDIHIQNTHTAHCDAALCIAAP